jgi:hypothetical protein
LLNCIVGHTFRDEDFYSIFKDDQRSVKWRQLMCQRRTQINAVESAVINTNFSANTSSISDPMTICYNIQSWLHISVSEQQSDNTEWVFKPAVLNMASHGTPPLQTRRASTYSTLCGLEFDNAIEQGTKIVKQWFKWCR